MWRLPRAGTWPDQDQLFGESPWTLSAFESPPAVSRKCLVVFCPFPRRPPAGPAIPPRPAGLFWVGSPKADLRGARCPTLSRVKSCPANLRGGHVASVPARANQRPAAPFLNPAACTADNSSDWSSAVDEALPGDDSVRPSAHTRVPWQTLVPEPAGRCTTRPACASAGGPVR